MSPQPRPQVPPPRPPHPNVATPSPGDAPRRLPIPSLATASRDLRGPVTCGRAVLAPAPLTDTPDSRLHSAPQTPPKCAPKEPKSFLEKTLNAHEPTPFRTPRQTLP